MRIKSQEWIDFKKKVTEVLQAFQDDMDTFLIPEEHDNFQVIVNGIMVNPIFSRKAESMQVEYDFTLCPTSIRTLSISKYKDCLRIQLTTKQ